MKNLNNAISKIAKTDRTQEKQFHGLIIIDKVMTFIPSWPLIVHLLSGFVCMGLSATFHLMWITNRTVQDWLSRFDYAGICILIMGSSYPPIFYAFSCGPILLSRNIFLAIISTTSTLSLIVMVAPSMQENKYRTFRALLFIFLGLSAGIPFIYMNLTQNDEVPHYLPSKDGTPWLVGGLVYIAGALNYAFRFPEKFYPFKFDIIGASHQIFHVAVLFGFGIMFKDSIRLYNESQSFVCPIVV